MAIAIAPVRSMNAIVVERPGRVGVKQTAVPAVAKDEVLIRVRGSSANPVDQFPTTGIGYLMGRRKPRVIGTDYAGVIECVGKDVSRFRPGDEVFGGANGAFAEYVCVKESSAIAIKPPNVSFEQAGTVAVAATTALQALRDHGRLERGQQVLINGASGGVGTFCVQIARALGAHVTAVCSTRNVAMVRSLGAEPVIDYTRDDFTRGGSKYDLLLDVAGTHSLSQCRRVLAPEGTYVGVGAAGVQNLPGGMRRAIGHFLQTRATSIGVHQRVVTLFIASLTAEDMAVLAEMLGDGRVTPEIDRRYSMNEAAAALRYLKEGHARAKLAIAV